MTIDSNRDEVMFTMDLTDQEILFCNEYLKDFNATRAARAAGYSEKHTRTTASRLVARDNIRRYLQSKMNVKLRSVDADITRIIEELKLIAFSDLNDIMNIDAHEETMDPSTGDVTIQPSVKMRPTSEIGEKTRVIAEITEDKSMYGTKRKVKLYDKMKAIELLGKYNKMFTDQVEVTNPDGKLQPLVNIYLPKKE
jgi:phage terminase small subunit